jgi:hypothetical protein
VIQQFTVAIIVLFAALYAAWYWMPRSLRRKLGEHVRRWGKGAEAANGSTIGATSRFAAVLEQSPGCASCESCGGCGTPGAPEASSRTGGVDGHTHPITIFPRRS